MGVRELDVAAGLGVSPLNDFLTRHKWAIEIIVPGGFAIYLLTLGTILLL